MSSPIWTRVALSSEFRRFDGACWRLVEAQHRVSTLKLTDTLAEQALLENLVEETKPAIPPECRHLDFLLATPFRYGAVYPDGSRFRRAGRTLGVYYAAESVATAVAETAFYRLLFFAESPATPWPSGAAEFTAFSAAIATARLLDLTSDPLSLDSGLWTDPTDYGHFQAFADAVRATEADMIRYRSVRDPAAGVNLAILTCRAFSKATPVERQTWRIL
ncbi:RES family NAD+ phosphorylase [Polymorphum gilvum]|uniref:RES domain protein n=1 Tax=Polymorphum gilvum (strain LMG 25793 / CGMCC 1.9160 / SL003B-26A1) TaxID=991905 RepID=F2J624_POLGS|nr:RES family NAD+ phosphorylase [Polymorphum gilvum]ADZ72388.1 RES domain protein [Polymorphum gilvum SL003B-26A1]